MHMTNKRWAALFAATMCVASACAETLTWNGDATGDFTASANWSPAQAPQPGDTLVINKAVTFDAATFDVGSEGLTVQTTAKVVSQVAFTGSGSITVRSNSAGYFQIVACSSHTGDWHLYDGTFEPNATTLGSGTIYVESGSSNARLQIGQVRPFKNDIRIVGTGSTPAIVFSNCAQLTGVLSSDADFTINVAWVNGGTRAEIQNLRGWGTVTVNCDKNANRNILYNLDFSGLVEAQIVKNGAGTVRFTGVSTAAGTTVTVNNGTVEFIESAAWGGSSVTANGATSVLRFNGRNLTSDVATVSVTDGAKIDLATLAAVPRVTIGEMILENGFYRAADQVEGLMGNGFLSVGGDVATWIGGEEGAWSDGANWSTGIAPNGATIAKFTNAVELANETFDFGDVGVCIWNLANADLIQRTMFEGAGKYCKFGAGKLPTRRKVPIREARCLWMDGPFSRTAVPLARGRSS